MALRRHETNPGATAPVSFPARVHLPKGQRLAARWRPRIGSVVPNFTAPSTQGPIAFHGWAKGSWTLLFSHPFAYTPVCSTELADFGLRSEAFAERDVKLMGITQSSLAEETAWVGEVEEQFGTVIDFPIVADPKRVIGQHFGIYDSEDAPGYGVRRTYVIDPDLKLRVTFAYPDAVGRGTDELIRVIDALQTGDAHGVSMPSDWRKGDDCLVQTDLSDAQADRAYGRGWSRINRYIRVVDFGALMRRARR